MGFHKRHFDMKLIEANANSHSFSEFKRYLLNPDACIFMDNKSSDLWKEFADGNEETRINIYKKLRNEN